MNNAIEHIGEHPLAAIQKLRNEIRERLGKETKLQLPLEARVESFTANPGMNYAKHAVAFLWQLRKKLTAGSIEIDDLPAMIFSNCKTQIVISDDTDEKVFTHTVIRGILEEAINDAVEDILVCQERDNAGGEGIPEQRVFFVKTNDDHPILSPIPEHCKIDYRRWHSSTGARSVNIVDKVHGLRLEDCTVHIPLSPRYTLASYCDAVRVEIRKMRQRVSTVARDIHRGAPIALYHSEPKSPFESGMGRFLFQKITGEVSAHVFNEDTKKHTLDHPLLEKIIEATLAHCVTEDISTNTLWRVLLDVNKTPRTKKALSDYLLARTYDLIDQYGDQFFTEPTSDVEITFLKELAGNLGNDVVEKLDALSESYNKAPIRALIKKTRTKIRKNTLPTETNHKIIDLYRQLLVVYKTYEAGKLKIITGQDSDHEANGEFLQKAALVLMERVNSNFVAFETSFFTANATDLESFARLLVQDTRKQMSLTLERVDELAEATREVEEIAPTTE